MHQRPSAAPDKMRWKHMSDEQLTATEFDRRFDEGESVIPYADLSKAERPNRKTQKVNVDFPTWMVRSLDKEAAHLGISRQALVKVWIANCLLRESYLEKRL